MTRIARIGMPLVLLALAVGCASETGHEPAAPDHADSTRAAQSPQAQAVAKIEARSGSELEGKATFSDQGGSISMILEVYRTPPGEHAVHLHETGDCSAADGTSAGGHWNPTTEDHGRWGRSPHHLGDVGNLSVAADGTGSILLTTDRWSIGTGESNDIVGRAVIVHAKADDFTTQPTGAAGGRIGCGVIR